MPIGAFIYLRKDVCSKLVLAQKKPDSWSLGRHPSQTYLFERFAREPNVNVAALDAEEDARHKRHVTLSELTHTEDLIGYLKFGIPNLNEDFELIE